MNALRSLTAIANEKDKEYTFEQYKVIITSIDQINLSKATSNPFWSTANGVTITSISYINTLTQLTVLDKTSLTASLLGVGYLLCLAWISYLNTIRKNLEIRYEILVELENHFPVKYFQRTYERLNKKEGKLSLTFKELLVPCIFLGAYSFFLFTLVF